MGGNLRSKDEDERNRLLYGHFVPTKINMEPYLTHSFATYPCYQINNKHMLPDYPMPRTNLLCVKSVEKDMSCLFVCDDVNKYLCHYLTNVHVTKVIVTLLQSWSIMGDMNRKFLARMPQWRSYSWLSFLSEALFQSKLPHERENNV